MSIQQTEDVSVFKPEVKELALNGGMSGALFLRDGSFAVTFESFDGSDFAVPFTVAHVHRQGRGASEFGLNWRLNVNRKLKLDADDTDKNTRYVYTDEFGDDRAFSEEYYYLEGNVKKPIDDKSQIEIGANGTLTYNGSQVYKNQRCGGYTLIPEVNDFKGCELIERRIDEHVALEEYLLQTECELKSYLRVNAVSGAVSENSVDFGVAGNFTEENYAAFLNGVTAESEDIIIKDTDWLKWTESNRQVLVNAARKNLKSVKYSFKKYCRKKAELAVLQKNTPVCYLKDGSGITDGFNSDGDMVCSVDGYGNFVAIEYDESGKILSVYDNKGRTAAFAYGGVLKSITDNRGRKTEFLYDSSKRLTKITRPDGTYESLTYNAENDISKISVKNGNDCELSYYNNKIIYIYVKASYQTLSTTNIDFYDANTVRLHLPDNEFEEYKFDNGKRLIKYTQSDSTDKKEIKTFTYANDGKKVTIVTSSNVSPRTYTDIKEYDDFGLLVCEKTDRRQVAEQRFESIQTNYSYDAENKLILKRTVQNITIDYDPEGDSMTDFTYCFDEKYTYDNYGNLTLTESYTEGEEKTSGINFEQRVYNDNGNMVKCIRWNSLDSSTKFYEEYEREEDGTVKYEKDETGAYSAMYEYVNGTNLVNSVTFANGSKLAYGRNPHNDKVTAITQSTAEGKANTNDIEYGENGLPAKVKCGNTTLEYQYDYKGRKTEVKVNGSVQATYRHWDFDYDSEENYYTLTEVTTTLYTGSEQITINECDGGYGGSSGVAEVGTHIYINHFTDYWNERNQEGLITNDYYYVERATQLQRTYSYDNFNKVTKIVTKPRWGTAVLHQEDYSYDEYGKLSQKKLTGDVELTYNYVYKNTAARELDSVSVNGYKFKPLTDVNGRNTGKEIYNGSNKVLSEHITYRKVGDHATNMPSCVQYAVGNKYKDNIKYKYDSCGNISEITQNGHLVARYTYDSLNRLIREDNKPLDKTVLYHYDNAGNITQKCKYAYTEYGITASISITEHEDYEYEGDKLKKYSYGVEDKNGFGETVNIYLEEICEYNNLGNPTKYRGKECTWQYGKRLTNYGNTTFAYDTLGRRAKKGNITYTYDNDNRLIKQSNGLEFFYDESGVAAVKWNGATYFYMKDAQGNIIALLDVNGNVVTTYRYDAWGNHTVSGSNTSLGNANPFRYRGYYYDTETKLYYLQSRYYDPEVGRFISQDSVEYADPETINGLNLYAYCGNNPVMNVDPTGTWSWSKFWRGLGRIITGVAAVVVGALAIASGVAGIAMIVTAGVTFAAGALTFVNGTADIGEAFSDYNFMRDGVFQGNSTAYNWYSGVIKAVAIVGTMVCGGWLKYNAPRIKAYKNISNYSFTETISDTTHMARPYQQSSLLQKQIIKYGKMIKEGDGIVKFIANGTYRIGFDGNFHRGTWKLVVDVVKQIIMHIGPF